MFSRAAAFADRAVERLAALGVDSDLDGAGLLTIRSSFTGHEPVGATSAGGSCRLLRSADGWIAANLPREDDLELLPAWLDVVGEEAVPWDAIAQSCADRTVDAIVASGQELGLAVSALGDPRATDEQLEFRGTSGAARPWLVRRAGERRRGTALDSALVVDLSSLWAGPSCARLLGLGGARIVKVESTSRPDGSRAGDPAFHAWLHDGHELVEFDFASEDGRRALRALLAEADVVIEGSRPRALERLGIEPTEVLAARAGAVWVSITGYGRCGPWRDRVAFGDDAAVAGGLVDRADDGSPTFVGDAIADPLTGVVAAALAAGAISTGGGMHIDVGLREIARAAAAGAVVVW